MTEDFTTADGVLTVNPGYRRDVLELATNGFWMVTSDAQPPSNKDDDKSQQDYEEVNSENCCGEGSLEAQRDADCPNQYYRWSMQITGPRSQERFLRMWGHEERGKILDVPTGTRIEFRPAPSVWPYFSFVAIDENFRETGLKDHSASVPGKVRYDPRNPNRCQFTREWTERRPGMLHWIEADGTPGSTSGTANMTLRLTSTAKTVWIPSCCQQPTTQDKESFTGKCDQCIWFPIGEDWFGES